MSRGRWIVVSWRRDVFNLRWKSGVLLGGSHSQLDQAVIWLTCHWSADLTHRIARILDLFCRLPSEKNTPLFGNWTGYSSCSTEIVLGSRMVYIGHMKHNREQLDGPMCSTYAYVRGCILGPERVKSSHWWWWWWFVIRRFQLRSSHRGSDGWRKVHGAMAEWFWKTEVMGGKPVPMLLHPL